MKYITDNTVFDSWKSLIEIGKANKATLNRFFGLLELIKNIENLSSNKIACNQQYSISSNKLSLSLQNLYYFGNDPKASGAIDTLNVIFPNSWQNSVLKYLLKGKPIPIEHVAIVCLQNESFDDNDTLNTIVERFKEFYHISDEESQFFSSSDIEVAFSGTKLNRQTLFNSFKDLYKYFDIAKMTIGFTNDFFNKQAGELTAGPFIQPLYAGQENLRFLLIANFDLKAFYNINQDDQEVILQDISLEFLPRNKIIYGAPGTGKSYELRFQAKANGFTENETVTITFHPNYTYQNFVGSYKPTPIYRSLVAEGVTLYGANRKDPLPSQTEPLIDYSFTPGPFLNILIKAIENPSTNYMLIIEEINRANVTAVFGDIFQLLDRDSEGESEYEIQLNSDIINYLETIGISKLKVRIPKNLFIWATMNSADQGVMPLDSAFKRRWSFEYLSINEKQSEILDRTILFQNEIYSWNRFRTELNERLKLIPVSEDKLIGPFFLSKNELINDETIKNKLLLYLRDDVVRHNPENLFRHKTFSDIVTAYKDGEEIFVGMDKSRWLIE